MSWKPFDFRCAADHLVECWLSSPTADPARDDADRRCATCNGRPVERVSALESFMIRDREDSATRARHGTYALAGMRPDSVRLTFGYGSRNTRSSAVGRDRNREFIAEQRRKHAPRTWLDT